MIIYKTTKTGATQQWSQEIEGSKYRTISGQVDGKLIISEWTQCQGTNIGQSNERSPEEQAIFEVDANYKKKLEKDYHASIDDIDEGSHIFECMLAYEYKKSLKRSNPPQMPLWSQPKLNGMRRIAKKDGLWTRNGKPILSAPHIVKALKPYFDKNPYRILDGELYSHSLKDDFNSIMSIFKKSKPSAEDLKVSEEFGQYHVYDFPACGDQIGFENRLVRLANAVEEINSPYVILVKTNKVNSQEELDDLFKVYLGDGYEGQIVRTNGVYDNKRSWNLLKRKEFMDEEFKLLDISEGLGNWQGKAKSALLEMKDGRQFSAGITGTMEYCAELLKNKEKYIGKMTTVNFFQYTPDGIPLFGRCKEFDRMDI
jgi:DNA ligase-1